MKKQLLFLCFVCLLGVSWGFAQTRQVTGRIIDEKGQAQPGVTIIAKGTTIGTTSDGDGRYLINVPVGTQALVFTAIGFQKKEIALTSESVLDVALKEDVQVLDEIVKTGYLETSKREVTGAISTVSGKTIENLPMQSFDRAMQGRMAGVQINSASGTPGGAVAVRIRGVGSISAGNEPLYIVDGVQMNNRNDGGGVVNTNPLAFLNPNDIESIEVIKDAATAAIYGAQAGNGVVLVTTKRGKASQKTTVTLNYYTGVVEPLRKLDVMNSQQILDARARAIQYNNPTQDPLITQNQSLSDPVRGLGLLSFNNRVRNDSLIASLPTYDWQGAVYKPGAVHNYEISAQGGNDRTTFYTSLAFNRQDAALINIDFRRLTGKLNLTHKITQKLTLDLGLNLSTFTQRGPYGDSDGSLAFGAPQYSAPIILPWNPIYNPDGTYYGMPGNPEQFVGDIAFNVRASSDLIRSKGITNQLVTNMALIYRPIKELTLKGFVGLDYRTLATEFYGDQRLQDYFNIGGFISLNNNTNRNLTTNFTATYVKTFAEKHNISALLGAEYRGEVQESNGVSAQTFPTPDFTTANAAATPLGAGGFWTGFRRAGVFGNVRYDYDGRYVLNLILRYDGSSRFGINNQFGFFPSAAAAWNISSERFMENIKFISTLRLRASYGVTGNDQIGNFTARNLYGLGGTYGGRAGLAASSLGNTNLRWERNQTVDVGLEYGLFDGRLRGSFGVFRRASKDLLLTRSLPVTNGFGGITENIGEVVNRGLEIDLTSINLDKGGFRWETNFNITFIDNTVTKLYDGLQVLPGNLGIRVGSPLGTNVAVPYAGVNPATGRPMWYDINGNLTYLVAAVDQRPLGHADLSRVFGGFTNTFRYKGIELSVFFQYDYGRTVANLQEFRLADNVGVARNGLVHYYNNAWRTPGQITDVPAAALNRTQHGRISSYQQIGRFYQDASYIRLKQVTLSYDFNQALLSKLKLAGLRVYLQGVNLLTWTNWSGFDPEFINLNGNGNQGIIPQSRNYTFGVQLTF